MQKTVKFIREKFTLLAAMTIAAVVGGLGANLVRADVPDASGQITACYRNNGGAVHIIDAEDSEVCSNQETALSWPKTGNRVGYMRVIEDPLSPGDFILDTAHTKGIKDFKAVNCANAIDPVPLGCPYAGTIAFCFNFEFTPHYIENNHEFGTLDNSSASSILDIYCGSGYYAYQSTNGQTFQLYFFE
jgi:hypothetical protein